MTSDNINQSHKMAGCQGSTMPSLSWPPINQSIITANSIKEEEKHNTNKHKNKHRAKCMCRHMKTSN